MATTQSPVMSMDKSMTDDQDQEAEGGFKVIIQVAGDGSISVGTEDESNEAPETENGPNGEQGENEEAEMSPMQPAASIDQALKMARQLLMQAPQPNGGNEQSAANNAFNSARGGQY